MRGCTDCPAGLRPRVGSGPYDGLDCGRAIPSKKFDDGIRRVCMTMSVTKGAGLSHWVGSAGDLGQFESDNATKAVAIGKVRS
jgi:hypothetical protein